jgi:hypothetical protein
MRIIDRYYDADWKTLTIEFSTHSDGDVYYRELVLSFDETAFYAPTLIDEEDMSDIDDEFIIELIEQYVKDNDLPEPIEL